ncbi:MAG: DUF554 domain-containing protein [Candidatus Adiutrix sp.]|jgi:uncharacterized membrane protein YqgA involved in biofilm formation|nr:DUF554 domain-containing protein [Candidatus Adiutrix sp.]
MIVPVGALVNAGAVVVGGGLGLAAGRIIGQDLRDSVFQVLGLCTVLIGLKMAWVAPEVMVVIISCVLGALTGQALGLAGRLARAGDAVKKMCRSGNEKFTDGLVTTSLIICVGAMGLVGSLEEGLGGSPSILYAKSILDFFAVAMLASVYGSGAVFSAGPLLIYQGGLTLAAGLLQPYLTKNIENSLVATGGLLVMAIGCNLLGLKRITVENLLPALVYAVVIGALTG